MISFQFIESRPKAFGNSNIVTEPKAITIWMIIKFIFDMCFSRNKICRISNISIILLLKHAYIR